MARLLKPYGVAPKTIRLGETTPKGYEGDQFADSWERYLSPLTGISGATPATLDTAQIQSPSRNTGMDLKGDVAASQQIQASYDVAPVAGEGRGSEEGEELAESSRV